MNINNQDQTEADTLAQEHEQADKAQSINAHKSLSKALANVIRLAKEDEPVYAEMAARINERNRTLMF